MRPLSARVQALCTLKTGPGRTFRTVLGVHGALNKGAGTPSGRSRAQRPPKSLSPGSTKGRPEERVRFVTLQDGKEVQGKGFSFFFTDTPLTVEGNHSVVMLFDPFFKHGSDSKFDPSKDLSRCRRRPLALR